MHWQGPLAGSVRLAANAQLIHKKSKNRGAASNNISAYFHSKA
jgi:hypothetical protein